MKPTFDYSSARGLFHCYWIGQLGSIYLTLEFAQHSISSLVAIATAIEHAGKRRFNPGHACRVEVRAAESSMSEHIVCDGVPESLIHIDALFIEFRSKDVRRPRLYHARADWGRHCRGLHRRVLGRANMMTWWCVALFARALNQDLHTGGR